MRKVVRAIFRGQDGSLGYEKNKEYTIAVSQETGKNIKIERYADATGQCEYSNVNLFLENWDNIRLA